MSDHLPDPALAVAPAAIHRALPVATRNRARIATMALFFVAGMMYASWGVHVPTVRDRFHLSPALLSYALFAVAGGSIAAMTAIGSWIARVGTRRACLTGGLVMAFGSTLRAPHGGVWVAPLIGQPLGFLAAVLIGTVVMLGAIAIGTAMERRRT